jgi:hypothetical protein
MENRGTPVKKGTAELICRARCLLVYEAAAGLQLLRRKGREVYCAPPLAINPDCTHNSVLSVIACRC